MYAVEISNYFDPLVQKNEMRTTVTQDKYNLLETSSVKAASLNSQKEA